MKAALVTFVAAIAAPALVPATDLTVRTRTSQAGSMVDRARASAEQARNPTAEMSVWTKWLAGKQIEHAQQQAAEGQQRALQSLEPREQVEYMSAQKSVLDSAQRRVIVDVEAKTIATIEKEKQTYFVKTFEEQLREIRAHRARIAEQAEKLPPRIRPLIDDGPVTLRPTGRTETIAGYEAKEYTSDGTAHAYSVWVTEALEEPTQGRTWEAIKGLGRGLGAQGEFAAAKAQLKGLPLRSISKRSFALGGAGATAPGGDETIVTEEVIDIVQGPIPAEVLTVPSGYARIEAPAQAK